MKHIKIIARENIINPNTGKMHDDEGLFALDGYFESKIFEVDDSDNEETLISKFEEDNPKVKGFNFEIIEIK